MTIELSDNIDIITVSEETGRIYLNISDHLNWDSPDKLLILQNKVNRYLAFIESGEMVLQQPQAAFLNPVICLISQYPIGKTEEHFLIEICSIIEDSGYSFEWKSFDIKTNQFSHRQEQ